VRSLSLFCLLLGVGVGTACRAASPPPAPAAVPLDVRVEAQDDTGTMHYADRLVIRGPGSPAPLVLRTELEPGVLVPLVTRQVPLDPENTVLLGWSSTGGGMQTEHALLVRARPGAVPAVVDELALTTDRAAPPLVVDAAAGRGVRIGVVDSFGGELHEPSDWKLHLADHTLDLAALRGLPFDKARVAWFQATKDGFRATVD
jgi:hypothetical protein